MKNTFFLSIIILFSLFCLTGCSDLYTNSIDDYYFVISLAIDKLDDGNIKLSIQLPSNSDENISTGATSQSSNYKIYSAEAKTIDEAITVLDNYLNKQINLSHCSAIVFSEELAKEGINTYISSLNNNVELRYNCQTIISSGSAYEVLEKVSNSGEAFSARLFDYLKNTANYTGFTMESPFGNFVRNLESNYSNSTAIYVKVNGDIIQTSRNICF